jgi:hypothetical protein
MAMATGSPVALGPIYSTLRLQIRHNRVTQCMATILRSWARGTNMHIGNTHATHGRVEPQ